MEVHNGTRQPDTDCHSESDDFRLCLSDEEEPLFKEDSIAIFRMPKKGRSDFTRRKGRSKWRLLHKAKKAAFTPDFGLTNVPTWPLDMLSGNKGSTYDKSEIKMEVDTAKVDIVQNKEGKGVLVEEKMDEITKENTEVSDAQNVDPPPPDINSRGEVEGAGKQTKRSADILENAGVKKVCKEPSRRSSADEIKKKKKLIKKNESEERGDVKTTKEEKAKSDEDLKIEQEKSAKEKLIRENVKKVLDRDYKNMSKKDFEDMLIVAVMDYFCNYNPTIELRKKVAMLERLVTKLQENYTKTTKQFFEAKFVIKRMVEMKEQNPSGNMELPFKLIRSVAVQVQSTRCRGGDLCPGQPSLPHLTNKNLPSKPTILRKDQKSPQQPVSKPVGNAQKEAAVPEAKEKETQKSPSNSSPAKPSAVPLKLPSPPKPPQPSAVVIDLTDKEDAAEVNKTDPSSVTKSPNPAAELIPLKDIKKVGLPNRVVAIEKVQLPSLPVTPRYPTGTRRPPQPQLKVNKADQSGIMLSWTLKTNCPVSVEIASYQVYACQENSGVAREWSSVGDVRALPLPMACTLSQFREGHRYHFVVRAVDKYRVLGDFSHPASILLVNKGPTR